MGWREFDGRTVKEALQNAAEEMGVEKETLSYEVVKDDGSGLLGLIGLKKARVRVRSGNDEIQEKIDEIKREIGIPIDEELSTEKPLVQRVQTPAGQARSGAESREPAADRGEADKPDGQRKSEARARSARSDTQNLRHGCAGGNLSPRR